MDNVSKAISDIERTADLLEKAMKLAGLVTSLFDQAGWNLVVVGGSAVEFYTEGSYMSGDVDFCRRTLEPIPLRKAQDIMSRLNAVGGPRSWEVAGMFVDLLGFLENEAKTALRTVQTPYGPITIIPLELAVVERVLLAYYPARDDEARAVAKKLLAVCMNEATSVDWAEVSRLAALPSFNIVKELAELKNEVARELKARS